MEKRIALTPQDATNVTEEDGEIQLEMDWMKMATCGSALGSVDYRWIT